MPEEILITNGMLVDGNGTAPVAETSLWVRDGEIAGIGNQDKFKVSKDAVVIDATGKTVMPGLIDSHLHSTFDDVQSNDELFFHRDSVMSALVTTQNLVKILRSGGTSFVDPDTAHGIGPAIRNAIEAGVIQGPRMKTGVQALLTAVGGTAGHLIPDKGTVGYAQIVNSVDEVIMWTRRHIKYGADWIKLHATGSLSGRPGELMVWSREEVRAACNAAKDLGVPVMAHCETQRASRYVPKKGFL